MRSFFKRLWCVLRSHPYPRILDGGNEGYQEWVGGDEPFSPEAHCTNCGASIKRRNGGMGS